MSAPFAHPARALVPVARTPISIRLAALADYPFIDRLQDLHSKALGFMPRAQLEGKIKLGHVLIAEDEMRLPIGYCMSQDRYFKRDDVGIIYQMNVAPTAQRKLAGAMLLKAVFDRAAYGCKLFCCWCAQDLGANYFWESLGFIPLAFRAGAGGKRTHIFWQRRVREGDTTTPYWFPAKTDGGHMREDRLVLPIPPGVHWKDAMPVLLPEAQKALPEPAKKERSDKRPKPLPNARRALSGLSFVPAVVGGVEKPKPQKPKREKVKADPKHVAAARELRDRYLEHVNADAGALLSQGKYAIARQLGGPAMIAPDTLLLPAA